MSTDHAPPEAAPEGATVTAIDAARAAKEAGAPLDHDVLVRMATEVQEVVAYTVGRAFSGGGTPQKSKQVTPVSTAFDALGPQIVHPVYDPRHLSKLPEFSSILPQCIRARAENIGGHGWQLVPVEGFDLDDLPDGVTIEEVKAEKKRLRRFFNHASTEIPFTELIVNTQTDRDTVGWGVWEYIRDAEGVFCGLEHMKGATVRLGKVDGHATLVTRLILNEDGTDYEDQNVWRRLRLYAQDVGHHHSTGRVAWFKSVGDPRVIDRSSGRILAQQDPVTGDWVDAAGKPTDVRPDPSDPEQANEVLWIGTYNAGGLYPVPPWIGTMINVGGAHGAELVNWLYFENKSVPPMALLVQGGKLSKASVKAVKERFEGVKGVKNWHKVLIIEATKGASGRQMEMMNPGAAVAPKIEFVELTKSQHKDALFLNYDTASRLKIRSSTGVPPIHIGETEDYSRASAEVSDEVAERGTYGPPRRQIEDRINRNIMPELKALYWRIRLLGPNLVRPEQVRAGVEAGVKAGVGSPNEYAPVIEKLLGVEFKRVSQPWANAPIALVQAALQVGGISLTFDESGAMQVGPGSEAVGGDASEALERVAESFLDTFADRLIERVLRRVPVA